ncbi:YijD family membrane protein [Photobacterium toruni]|uniref:Inner membrane protein YijD n=1 Tax=Photobacterium toruni TaxID=1935446 RepID=A0A1T4U1L6_9GAMM|nr:YijD family membrane protein [Photobacterium toruni]MEC6816245.1 YijD family membrane protein [Photobacterium toruni]MEC6832784.1 YijD family membrane protein [Photobacterium toruni]SKA46540.1 Inner membrane protein YijD [Photobacterium toruni]
MEKQQLKAERKTLVLSIIAGVCGYGTLAVLFSSYLTFSIFPVLAFVMAVYCLYQEYMRKPMAEGVPAVASACFFVGIFGYAALLRAEYPAMGSNFIPLMIVLALLFWVSYKMGVMDKKDKKAA